MPLLKSADWPLLIDIYFFLGGLAGGAFLIAVIADFMGRERNRDVVRVGYYLSLLALIPAPLILIVDLGVPVRFWHMLMVPKPDHGIGMSALNLGWMHFKPYSPMNVGSWVLLVLSLFAFLAALTVFLEDTRRARDLSGLRILFGLLGLPFALFFAAYPGVLLGATARPLFQNARFLGVLFVAVGATSGAAAIALILLLRGRETVGSLSKLRRFLVPGLLLQALALVLFIVAVSMSGAEGAGQSLGVLLSGQYSLLFWVGAVVVGLLIPLALAMTGPPRASAGRVAISAVLILVGGFLVKYAITSAGQVVF